MGFLDGLCDYEADEAEVSWHSFWRVQNLCSLTTLGAAIPCLVALLTLISVVAQSGLSPAAGGGDNGSATSKRQLNLNDNGGGHEESKGGEHDELNGFEASATEPLLGRDGARGDDDDDDGVGLRKKGTGLHWAKLLLYWMQAFYHLSVGAYDLVDGHADDPYKCECGARGWLFVHGTCLSTMRLFPDVLTRSRVSWLLLSMNFNMFFYCFLMIAICET